MKLFKKYRVVSDPDFSEWLKVQEKSIFGQWEDSFSREGWKDSTKVNMFLTVGQAGRFIKYLKGGGK